MPSDTNGGAPVTARCYCGATQLHFSQAPLTAAYCHCSDCRRWTGAPVAAFAAFSRASLTASPALGAPRIHTPGVERWNCPACGSPLAAQFDYLPDQVYIPLGIIDQAAGIAPTLHCHADAQMPWLHITDTLPRAGRTARATLGQSGR